MAEVIHHCNGLVDDSPSRWSQLHTGEVEGGNIVRIMLKATVYTEKEALAPPVDFINIAAPWTCNRSVLGFSIDDRYSSFKSLVFDKRLQSSKSPTMEVSVLAFPVLSSVADSSQLFHHNYVAFFEAVDESPANLMENSVNIPPLSSTQPFQPPLCGGCAFGLERGAELPKTMPSTKKLSTFNFEAVRGNEKVLQA
ncbi:MAG: hypothetical protein QXT73_06705, partial [Candidatus Methanomethylicaceae archaeon]